MKLTTEGQSEEMMDFFFSLWLDTWRKGCSLKVKGGKYKKKNLCFVNISNWESTQQMYLDFVLYIVVSRIFERFTKVYSSGFKTHRFKPLHTDQSVIPGCLGKLNSAVVLLQHHRKCVHKHIHLQGLVCAALLCLKAYSRVFGQVVMEHVVQQGVSKKWHDTT